MSRIFASLSVFALIFLILDLTIGLCGPDFNGLSAEYRQNAAAIAGKLEGVEPLAAADADALRARLMAAKGYVRWHILFGILAAVATVLVQSVGVTYFIGTGRWCKEVVETYELDEDWVKRSNRTKRASFPWAMLGMSTVLAIAAFGAAADPGDAERIDTGLGKAALLAGDRRHCGDRDLPLVSVSSDLAKPADR